MCRRRVSNFTVLQNQFSPEFGHSNGGQFNIVVKSGTNNFHGGAYEYFQNRNLNAIDQSVANSTAPGDPIVNPRFDSNRYGGQFGGPIFKSKLFFFANYEYNEVGQASVPGAPLLAPTSAGYAAMLTLSGVFPANVNALQKYVQAPTATSAVAVGTGCDQTPPTNCVQVPVGTLPIQAPNFTNFKALTTSMDFDISERDQIRGRYIYNQSAAWIRQRSYRCSSRRWSSLSIWRRSANITRSLPASPTNFVSVSTASLRPSSLASRRFCRRWTLSRT